MKKGLQVLLETIRWRLICKTSTERNILIVSNFNTWKTNHSLPTLFSWLPSRGYGGW